MIQQRAYIQVDVVAHFARWPGNEGRRTCCWKVEWGSDDDWGGGRIRGRRARLVQPTNADGEGDDAKWPDWSRPSFPPSKVAAAAASSAACAVCLSCVCVCYVQRQSGNPPPQPPTPKWNRNCYPIELAFFVPPSSSSSWCTRSSVDLLLSWLATKLRHLTSTWIVNRFLSPSAPTLLQWACSRRRPSVQFTSFYPTMSQVESPSVETIASPTAAAHSILPMSQPAAVPAKRSNFSISNLLASEEDKTDGAKNVGRLADDVKTMPSSSAVGSPFLNASALAHLAHLHTHGSTSSSSSSAPGWTDWLGTAGLGPDTHQSLWSR